MPPARTDDLNLTRRMLLGFAALVLLPSRALASTPPRIGRVEAVRGTATAERDGEKRPLAPAAEVSVGDKISTGEQSRIELRLGEDTKVYLGDLARLEIDRFQETTAEIILKDGPMLLEKPAQSAPQSVRVESPFALIEARDSKIFAGPSQGVFGVLVVEGEASVHAGGRRVTLRPGEGTDIKSRGAAPTSPTRWGPSRVQAALASVD